METAQTWWQRVAQRVRSEISRSGMTEQRVSIESGIANVTLSRKLNGRYPFSLSDLENIADVLDVSPGVFLSDEHVQAQP